MLFMLSNYNQVQQRQNSIQFAGGIQLPRFDYEVCLINVTANVSAKLYIVPANTINKSHCLCSPVAAVIFCAVPLKFFLSILGRCFNRRIDGLFSAETERKKLLLRFSKIMKLEKHSCEL